jgi:hypothetical protein
MGKYFTFFELVKSNTAEKNGINNTPHEEEIIHNIEELIDILDQLREAWGSPIRVSSGYRCEKLNKLVGGSTTSSHLFGFAADLVPVNGLIDDFFEFVKKYFLSKDIAFDQIIDEYSGGSHWVHIGYKNSKGEQRKQIKIYKNGKYSTL